jgi:predicted dehydrogenase
VWAWKGWLLKAQASGGAALDLHIHDTDWILYTLGRPQAVTSQGRFSKTGCDFIVTQYHYDKAMAVAEGGWGFAPAFPFRMAFVALFEGGQVEFDTGNTPAFSLFGAGKTKPQKIKVKPAPPAPPIPGGNITDCGGYYFECQYFVECCQKKQAPAVVTPENAMEAVEVTLAELKSAETGKTVKL